MNYRHAYHAGNFADVFKHALLALCLTHFKGKDKPFFVLDTHAGVGLYDLDGVEAGKTLEWQGGIGRVLGVAESPPALAPYLDVLGGLNPGGGVRRYPGSPWLARTLSRPGDRIVLCELHPADSQSLGAVMADDRRVSVRAEDGYAAVKALLPPPERRGMVMIDPPFEKGDDFAAMLDTLREGVRRWATGTYALWYPIKDAVEVAAFHARLEDAAIPKTLAVDLLIRRPVPGLPRLDGCGFVFVNPPFGMVAALDSLLPWLADRLAQGDGGGATSRWLVGES